MGEIKRANAYEEERRIKDRFASTLLIAASIIAVVGLARIGDFRAQMRRTLANITGLLESEGCARHDIIRTTCYLRDIERDYEAFNEEQTAFFRVLGLDLLPASTGIQAILCRPELIVEIEATALFREDKQWQDRMGGSSA
jgi:enamine deaminase RidA (YjgF/YER057c/UK114 family)